jgi:branched-chain amino acid transport system substrate-binding protein
VPTFRILLVPVCFLMTLIGTVGGKADEPIVVIAAFNITGPEAVLDAPCYRGAELAVEKLNAAGGVLGRRIRLIAVDTASDARSTASKVQGALKSYPDAIAGIGFTDSTYALDAGRVFQKARLPFITPGATAPDLPKKVGDEMFLAAYGDDAQALVMAEYARNELKVRHVALWIDKSRVYTRTVGGFFDKFFRQRGGTIEKRTYTESVTDFRDFIAAFKAANPKPEAIYSASMPHSAVAVIAHVRAAGIDVPLLSGDGWNDEEIVVASKQKGIKQIFFTTHLFLGVDTPAMRAFVKAYTRKFGVPPPNAFAPLGFDTINLFADAIRRAGSIKPDAIRVALANTRDFQGVVGKIAYAPGSRVPIKAVSVIRIDKGRRGPCLDLDTAVMESRWRYRSSGFQNRGARGRFSEDAN